MSKNTTSNSYSAAGSNIAALCGLEDIDSMSADELADVLGFEKPSERKSKAQIEREETDSMMAEIRSRLLTSKELPKDEMATLIGAFGSETSFAMGEIGK